MRHARINGEVVGIYIASAIGAPLHAVNAARAVPARGLEGDRHFARAAALAAEGREVPPVMELSLIESEAIEALQREYGIRIEHAAARRNVVTRDVPLNHLVGRSFTIGAVRAMGIKLCEPCNHLEGLTQAGVRGGLIHRGGLRCQIITEGVIKPGDRIEDCATVTSNPHS